MPTSARLQREWFERVARPLEHVAATAPEEIPSAGAGQRLLKAERFLKYRIADPLAVAIVKATLGSREELLARQTREYLTKLVKAALEELRSIALPPKPSGREYNLTAQEERRLVRAYRRLTRFFDARVGKKIPVTELNAELAAIYPGLDQTVSQQDWPSVLRARKPRRRAMLVLVALSPLGEKAIQRRCYAADRGTMR